jgi:hypothetical protein
LFRGLTENDRANSLPPELTAEMYHSIVDPRLFLDTSVSFAEDGEFLSLSIFFFFTSSPLQMKLLTLQKRKSPPHRFVAVWPLEE